MGRFCTAILHLSSQHEMTAAEGNARTLEQAKVFAPTGAVYVSPLDDIPIHAYQPSDDRPAHAAQFMRVLYFARAPCAMFQWPTCGAGC